MSIQVSIIRTVVLFVLLTVFCQAALFGQSERGTISGSVTDSTGAVIPSAKVTVTNPSTASSITTVTTATGDYTVPALSPGQYNVRIDKEGFKPPIRSSVTVNAATNTRADVTLEVGTAQQAI